MEIGDLMKIGRRPGESEAHALARILDVPLENARTMVRMARRSDGLTAHGKRAPSAEEPEKLAAALEDDGSRMVRRGPGKRGSSGRVRRHGMAPPSRADREAAAE